MKTLKGERNRKRRDITQEPILSMTQHSNVCNKAICFSFSDDIPDVNDSHASLRNFNFSFALALQLRTTRTCSISHPSLSRLCLVAVSCLQLESSSLLAQSTVGTITRVTF